METTPNIINSHDILEELNRQEVTRHVPLITFLTIICITGCLGNAWVFYIYKTRYSSSNCRTFVLFLSLVDLFSAGFVVPIEIVVLFHEYIFKRAGICKLSVLLNTWPTLTSGFLLLAIAIDRYRKVCKPFSWQISHSQARFMCLVTALVGIAFSWISPVIYGIQTREHELYRVNVSECVETDAWKQTMFPLLNNIFFALLFLGALSGIVTMYCFIAVHVRRHLKRKAAFLNGKRRTVDSQEASELTIMSGKVMVKRHDNCGKTAKRGADSSDEMFCSSTSDDTEGASPAGELAEPDKARIMCSIEDHIEIDNTNKRRTMISRMLSFGRSSLALTKSLSIASNGYNVNTSAVNERKDKGQKQRHRTAFIMFLISVAFIVSYLPLLCILLIRTADSTFVTSLTDEGRTAYKFFLRSYYLNCAVNPVIYGLWDSRFRKHTAHLICRR